MSKTKSTVVADITARLKGLRISTLVIATKTLNTTPQACRCLCCKYLASVTATKCRSGAQTISVTYNTKQWGLFLCPCAHVRTRIHVHYSLPYNQRSIQTSYTAQHIRNKQSVFHPSLLMSTSSVTRNIKGKFFGYYSATSLHFVVNGGYV
jgi:hypothetical protein